jgi:hypothetical protein
MAGWRRAVELAMTDGEIESELPTSNMVRGGGCDGPDALTVVKGATRLVAE